jgi:hypothetical protein
MDESRKKTLWVCATILAAPKLAEIKDGETDMLQVDVVRDAVQKAERIIQHIDHRWPANRVPGLSLRRCVPQLPESFHGVWRMICPHEILKHAPPRSAAQQQLQIVADN